MEANTITAICALIVSVVATSLGVWSAIMQQRHRRLSVKPIASMPVADYENKTAVYLKNKGLGPMVVKTLRVTDKEGKIHDDIISHMPKLIGKIMWATFYDSVDNAVLENGKSLKLILLQGDLSNSDFQESRNAVRKKLKDLIVKIEYEDLYGTKTKTYTKSLSWFGRHELSD